MAALCLEVSVIPVNPRIDFPQLRAQLAERRISRKRFAETADLSYAAFKRYVTEVRQPGQLSRIKIAIAACDLRLTDIYTDMNLAPEPRPRLVFSS